MIPALNFTTPAGYQTLMATFNDQIGQDLTIISRTDTYTTLGSQLSSPQTFCASIGSGTP